MHVMKGLDIDKGYEIESVLSPSSKTNTFHRNEATQLIDYILFIMFFCETVNAIHFAHLKKSPNMVIIFHI